VRMAWSEWLLRCPEQGLESTRYTAWARGVLASRAVLLGERPLRTDYLSDSADVVFSRLSGVPALKAITAWGLKVHHGNENYSGSGFVSS